MTRQLAKIEAHQHPGTSLPDRLWREAGDSHATIAEGHGEFTAERIGVFDRMLARLAANPRATRWLVPLLRGYIRYAPFALGQRALWRRVVNPHFAWESHAFVASTVFGSKIAGNTRDILEQYIYYFGVWEPCLTRWISRRLAPGDTFVDVGANIGYFSLLASRLVGATGTVVAIEPSPTNFRSLEGNLARNRAGNVRAVNLAASDRTGLARLFRGPEANRGLTTIVEQESTANDCQFECEVETAPLGAILRPDEAQNARLIKVDVEGAEWPVVSGMMPLLSGGRPDLEVMVELAPERLAYQGKFPQNVLQLFHDAGFHPYRIENDYSPESYLTRQRDRRPLRMRTPIEQETDVIFSRQDAESL